MLIFVYGSLRKGMYNHARWQMDKLTLVGRGVTKPVYTLVDLGDYPGLYTGGVHAVVGEIYRVADDSEILQTLDRMEASARFERVQLEMATPPATEQVFGWVKKEMDSWEKKRPVLAEGDWVTHRLRLKSTY